MKLAAPKKRKMKIRFVKPAPKRSQLVESGPFNPNQIFRNWLLRTGGSPEAGLPASQIGLYTNFD